MGVLISGVFISKFKPSARFLAMWHVMCGVVCTAGIITYAFLGCEESEQTLSLKHDLNPSCHADCHCDFVSYSPVCGEDGFTYISACHAGCMISAKRNSSKVFKDCTCVGANDHRISTFSWKFDEVPKVPSSAFPGPCAVNCQKELFMFLAVMCAMKFIGATGRTSNFLLSIRCIDEKDKSVAIGLGATLVHLFAFIPSPILFGYILDKYI